MDDIRNLIKTLREVGYEEAAERIRMVVFETAYTTGSEVRGEIYSVLNDVAKTVRERELRERIDEVALSYKWK
jgi:hypothetical protein